MDNAENPGPPPDDLPYAPGGLPRRQHPLYAAIVGPEGLRAGWGLLLFAAIYTVLQSLIGWAVLRLRTPLTGPVDGALTPGFVLWAEGLAALTALAATLAMMRIERRSLAAYGLGAHHALRRFAAGAGWGIVFISSLVWSLRALGVLAFNGRALHGGSLWSYAGEWLAGFLCVGFFEEIFFRGYVLATLTRVLTAVYAIVLPQASAAVPASPQDYDPAGLLPLQQTSRARAGAFWTSAFLLSFGFGLVHTTNTGESPLGVIAAGVIGLVFCLSLWRSGSLWWAIGFHAAWDWGESYLWGVYDSGLLARGRLFVTHPYGRILLSGGRTGPEGSLLVFPLMAGLVGVILLTLRPGSRLPQTGLRSGSAAPPQTSL